MVIFRKNVTTPGKSLHESLTCIPHFQFQAFEVEFDFLKSLDIESKINQVRFYEIPNKVALLTANDRTIKLWKISDRYEHAGDSVKALKQGKSLRLPKKKGASTATAKASRLYKNAHAYHINSLDICSDAATFLSADDLRINLWNIERSDTAFNLVDFKPLNMTELNEVITCTRYFPEQSNLFHFSTSKGILRVSDLRESACTTSYSKTFKGISGDTNTPKGAYTELISAITDVKLSQSERYFAVRDYMTVKVWDIRMEIEPVDTITVHDHIEPHMSELYSSEAIFDKFEICFSPDGTKILTGSYNNKFYVYDVSNPSVPIAEASTPDFISDNDSDSGDPSSSFNPSKRNLHYAYHPSGDGIAVAGLAGLHLYHLSL